MCGIIAAISLTDEWDKSDIMNHTLMCMKRMKNRGQQAAGYTIFTPEDPYALHRRGSIAEPLVTGENIVQFVREDPINKLYKTLVHEDKSEIFGMLGHVRYNTEGEQSEANIHPVRACLEHVIDDKYLNGITLDMVVNGETAIQDEWKQEVKAVDRKGATNDSSYIAAMVVKEYSKNFDMNESLTNVYNKIFDWGMIAAAGFMRDDVNNKNYVFWLNDGGHPLCEAVTANGKQLLITSETAYPSQKGRAKSITEMEYGFIKWFEINEREMHTITDLRTKPKCFFERQYLMSHLSKSEGDEVASKRRACGRKLAEEHPPPDNAILDYVPESGKSFFHGYVNNLISSVKYRIKQILGRDHSSDDVRAFMLHQQNLRMSGIQLKIEVTYSDCKNEKIVEVDDSVVGFNNFAWIAYDLKTNGKAKEVHLRSGTPPIVGPCRAGIDIPPSRPIVIQLGLDPINVAKDHTELEAKLCSYIHPKLGLIALDSVGYLSVPSLIKIYNKNQNCETGHCFGCTTGIYPYKWNGMQAPYKFVPSEDYKKYIEKVFLESVPA